MTKKHFEAIARVLGETKAPWQTVNALIKTLEQFNPKFDRYAFRDCLDRNYPGRVVVFNK